MKAKNGKQMRSAKTAVLDRVEISKAVRLFLERRRPEPPLRAKLDYGFRFYNRSIELFSIRPKWNRPNETTEHAFAKATYVSSEHGWRVFWMRANLKWYRYEPGEVGSLQEFLKLVDEDKKGCFFG